MVVAIESGSLDRALSDGARTALNAAIGSPFQAEIGSTAVRFSSDLKLSVVARDVTVRHEANAQVFAQAKALRLVLDPAALVVGRFEINEIEADGIDLDASLLPAGPPADLSKFRIDSIPAFLERAFAEIDNVQSFIDRGKLDRMQLADLNVSAGSPGKTAQLASIDSLAMERAEPSSLAIDGMVTIGGQTTDIHVRSDNVGGRAVAMTAEVGDLQLTPFLLKRDSAGNARQGVDGSTAITMRARRAGANAAPRLALMMDARDGRLFMDGTPQELTSARLMLSYDFKKDTIELQPSRAVFGQTIVPFSGGLIDLDRLDGHFEPGSGIGIDFLVEKGIASIPTSGEAPVPFDFKIFGRYLHAGRELQVDQLTVSSPAGAMTGSLRARFGEASPELSFSAEIADMQTGAVKQLWPYWIADKPRRWVMGNLFGGSVARGSIGVFIPAGRMKVEPSPLHLDENELRLDLDIVGARVNVTGDIPPVRDTDAHLTMTGGRLDVQLKSGMSYFSSGRSVQLAGGTVTIADAYLKPLMGDIAVSVAGKADAVAELVTYKPIDALQRAGFEAGDFSGEVKADAKITVGLVRDQNPPPPVWQAHLDLSKVDVAREFSGRKISKFDGVLDIDPSAAVLSGEGLIDGVPMELALTEPVGETSDAKRDRTVKVTLNNEMRRILVPGLDDIIDGTIEVALTRIDDDRQAVVADLGNAVVKVPWVGWSKGQGVAAKAEFEISERDGQNHIDKFSLSGDGFGAKGTLVVGKSGLVSGELANVRLSSSDEFSVRVRQAKGGYDISVNGKSADIRTVIANLKSGGGGAGDDGGNDQSIHIAAKLDTVGGFGGESFSNVKLDYGMRDGMINALDFSGLTGSGQAIVGNLVPAANGPEITLTSSDAGAVARFANLYGQMREGLLNLKLAAAGKDKWNGSLDIRNFRVENEQRLQSMVSTPTGADGRSLNKAVKRNIDVSSEKFQRAFARLALSDGTLAVQNGIVRGEQIGATFQGTVRDGSGNMDLNGTFMPAYGLNRLFGELPFIGILLGNGRDRGLLGITFKLSGPTDKPNLVVNPLSIIAPGVFRQIFEFR